MWRSSNSCSCVSSHLHYLQALSRESQLSEHILNVGGDDFQVEVIQASLPVLVNFWADRCGPCAMMEPMFNKVASEYAGRVKFVKVKANDNQDLAARFDVRGFPMLLMFKDGEVVSRLMGSQLRSQVTNLLDRYVANVVEVDDVQRVRKFNAFHGDDALRNSVVERVERCIEEDRILRSMPAPDSDPATDCHSLMAAAASTSDPELYEDKLGIPAELGRLHESVHGLAMRHIGNGAYAFRGPSASYPVDWLRALQVGADLQRIVPAFLDWWLHDLAEACLAPVDEAVADMARGIAALHARVVTGDPPTRQEWKIARHQAGAVVEQCARCGKADDEASILVALAAEALAWPPEELDDSLYGSVASAMFALARRASDAIYSPEERSRRDMLAAAVKKRMEAMPNPTPEQMEADAVIRAYDAFRESMQSRESDAMHEAKYAYADRLHLELMRITKAMQ